MNLAGAPVARLRERGRPTAVARLISASAVDPVDSTCRPVWPLAHVGKEVLKTAACLEVPAITDRDPAATVLRVSRVGNPIAPRAHGAPRFVGGRRLAPLSSRMSMPTMAGFVVRTMLLRLDLPSEPCADLRCPVRADYPPLHRGG